MLYIPSVTDSFSAQSLRHEIKATMNYVTITVSPRAFQSFNFQFSGLDVKPLAISTK
jgi:hypothetical protein